MEQRVHCLFALVLLFVFAAQSDASAMYSHEVGRSGLSVPFFKPIYLWGRHDETTLQFWAERASVPSLMDLFWDHVAAANSDPESPIRYVKVPKATSIYGEKEPTWDLAWEYCTQGRCEQHIISYFELVSEYCIRGHCGQRVVSSLDMTLLSIK